MKKPAFIIYIFLLLFGSLLVGGCDDTDEAPATEAPPPPPTDPASYTQENVCVAEFCATDATLSAQCTTFLDACIAANPEANWDECVAGGLVICQNPDASAGDVCDYGLCATDPTLNQECLDFMAICTAESLNAEECVGAMLFKCQL